MKKCECSMAIRMLGDGCRYCQPQEYIDRLHEDINETSLERCENCDRFTPVNVGFGNCFLIEDDEYIWHKSDYCSRFERKE